MKWVLLAVGLVVALIALMAIIGSFIQRDHVAGSSITLHEPPDSVWRVVRDQDKVPQWWPAMRSSVHRVGTDGRDRWEQTLSGNKMTFVIEADEPPRRLVTRIESRPGDSFGGTWTFEIAPDAAGSRVTVTERGWIANPIFRFLARYAFGYYSTQEGYLTALGKRFGETVKPTRLP
jgi:uncharacterized protein YndB with AHSA1/START domain